MRVGVYFLRLHNANTYNTIYYIFYICIYALAKKPQHCHIRIMRRQIRLILFVRYASTRRFAFIQFRLGHRDDWHHCHVLIWASSRPPAATHRLSILFFLRQQIMLTLTLWPRSASHRPKSPCVSCSKKKKRREHEKRDEERASVTAVSDTKMAYAW